MATRDTIRAPRQSAASARELRSSEAPAGLRDALKMPLVEALLGRRSRRFALGDRIPDGAMAFTSKHVPVPLSDLERMLLVMTIGGNTGWQDLIVRNVRYAPYLSNYAGSAGGRTFPSAAGFETSELFVTDDSGTYFVSTRDAPALVEKDASGRIDIDELVEAHRARMRKISDRRVEVPRGPPHMDGHNEWCANVPGSTLFIPVADLAHHTIAGLCYFAQNGFCITDDIHGNPIPGIEKFRALVDVDSPYPLTFADQLFLGEVTAEISTACYAGALMLQAMGLGGWMYDGITSFSILGASGDPNAPGLGFRYDMKEGWPVPNPTGLMDVFEGYCPPHYADMRAVVEAFCERKYGTGGPFNPNTPGPYKDNRRIRGSAQVHDETFKECVALQAQYIYDTFGKFPATVPTMYCLMYLQAHHLDLDFYDHYFKPGAYLRSHSEHMKKWH